MIIFHVRLSFALLLGYYKDYGLQVDKNSIKQMMIDNTDCDDLTTQIGI